MIRWSQVDDDGGDVDGVPSLPNHPRPPEWGQAQAGEEGGGGVCDQRLAALDHGFAGLDDGFCRLDQREGSIVQSIGVEPSLYQLNFRAQMTADSASETFTFYFAKSSNLFRVWKQSRKKWEPTIPDCLQIFFGQNREEHLVSTRSFNTQNAEDLCRRPSMLVE